MLPWPLTISWCVLQWRAPLLLHLTQALFQSHLQYLPMPSVQTWAHWFVQSPQQASWAAQNLVLEMDIPLPCYLTDSAALGVIQLNRWKFLRSCRLEKLSQTRYGPDVCDLCDTFLHYIQAKKNYEHVEISCKKITYVSSEISCCKCMRSPHMHRFLAQSIMQTLATISSTSGHCLSQTPSWALFFYLL